MTAESSSSPPADNLRADLEAVYDAAAEAPAKPEKAERPERAPPPAKPDRAEAKPANEDAHNDDHAAEPAAEAEAPRQRDAFGRFVKNPEKAEAAPHANDEHANDETPDQPENADAEPEPDRPAIDAPASWSAAAKDTWNKLPRQAQEEILRRESDVQRGFQQRAEQLKTLEPLAQVIAPYREQLALRGIHPAQIVQQLLAVRDLLERNPVEGVAHVAQVYGVDLRNFAAAVQQAQQPQDPALVETQQRLARMEQLFAQSRQAAERAQMGQIQSEVDAMAKDPAYPYFEEARPTMAKLMETGICTTLAEAYDRATGFDPNLRARIIADQQRAAAATRNRAEKDAADRAKRAAVSVYASPSAANGSGRGKGGSLRDDIAAAYERAVHTR